MASIQKKGNSHYLVYENPYGNGKGRDQIWEKIVSGKDPEAVLAEYHVKFVKGTLSIPNKTTVREFIYQFVLHYAPAKWRASTYATNMTIIRNHIIGEIGELRVRKITPLDIDNLFARLRRKKKLRKASKDKSDYLSIKTLRITYEILTAMFKKAVEWKVIERENYPVTCEKPTAETDDEMARERLAWSGEQSHYAMQLMEEAGESLLHLFFHVVFACTLRNGEACGITLDKIDFENSTIDIDKQMQRLNKEAMEMTEGRDKILYVFPTQETRKSKLVLKNTKTKGSTRKIQVSGAVLDEIRQRLITIMRNKQTYGKSYTDNNLLFCFDDGSPIEPNIFSKWFRKWQQEMELDLPIIDVHGIRHSSVAHKMRISGGDTSAVKQDSGHATLQMLLKYADHSFDQHSKELLDRMEHSSFYGQMPEQETEKPPESPEANLDGLMEIIEKNPALQQRVLEKALLSLTAQQQSR